MCSQQIIVQVFSGQFYSLFNALLDTQARRVAVPKRVGAATGSGEFVQQHAAKCLASLQQGVDGLMVQRHGMNATSDLTWPAAIEQFVELVKNHFPIEGFDNTIFGDALAHIVFLIALEYALHV